MDSTYWLAVGISLFLVFPIITLLHELGHAVPTLLLAPHSVTVKMGDFRREKWWFERRLGRLSLQWYTLPGWAGRCQIEDGDPISPVRRIAIYLGGPLVSALLATTFHLLARDVATPDSFAWLICVITGNLAAGAFFMTIIPMRYPRWFGPYAGMLSDGALILRSIRELRPPAVAENG